MTSLLSSLKAAMEKAEEAEDFYKSNPTLENADMAIAAKNAFKKAASPTNMPLILQEARKEALEEAAQIVDTAVDRLSHVPELEHTDFVGIVIQNKQISKAIRSLITKETRHG